MSDQKVNDVEVIDDGSYTNTIIYIVISTVFIYIFYRLCK